MLGSKCVLHLYISHCTKVTHRGADKSLARSERKQAQKHVRDARDFNNIETRAVIKVFFFLQGKAPKEIHVILTETLACFLPGRANDLSASLYSVLWLTYVQTEQVYKYEVSLTICMPIWHGTSCPLWYVLATIILGISNCNKPGSLYRTKNL